MALSSSLQVVCETVRELGGKRSMYRIRRVVEGCTESIAPDLKTCPRCASMHLRNISSCRPSAMRIALWFVSHNRVLPSMAVSRNVTVPVGKPGAARCFGAKAGRYDRILRSPAASAI
jgi:hypothetical protein